MKLLESITWGQFLAAIVVLVIIYYAGILIHYKLNVSLGRKTSEDHVDDEVPDIKVNENQEEEWMNELEHIVNEIRYGVLEAGEGLTREELLKRIVKQVENYGGLRRPAYRYALNNFIIKYAKEICGVEYSEEELEAVWDNLPR